MATTSTTSSATGAAAITKTLGAGSGIDLSALVTSLVDAQFATKNAQLTAQSDKIAAQISGVAKLKSGISGFSAALAALAKGGTLATTLTSGDPSVVRATATGSAGLAGLSATIEVKQLAGAQTATTVRDGLAKASAIGTGKLRVDLGTQATPGDASTFTPSGTSFDIEITDADNTLEGIAKKITAANRGITASVVTDSGGNARLVMKGATGATRAFEITASDADGNAIADGSGLAMFNTGRSGVTTVAGTPQDAKFTWDGIEVARSGNTVTDLVDGLKLELAGVKSGPVAITGTAATAGLSQAVNDVVSTYNEMLSLIKEETDIASGVLARDSAAGALTQTLRGITLIDLNSAAPAGTPRTLAEIGVSTNRDGTLSVDATKLAAALASHPGAIEAMFVTTDRPSGGGLPGALAAIARTAGSATTGFDAATQRYTKAKTALADSQTKASEQAEALRSRLTQQFASMDSRVAAYKSTQSFIEQQVKVWTRSDD